MEQAISNNKKYLKFQILLLQKNVSVYEVSKQTGILLSTFGAWKRNEYTPKIDKLMKLANYFEVPVSYFLEE